MKESQYYTSIIPAQRRSHRGGPPAENHTRMRKIPHLLQLGWTYRARPRTELSFPPFQYTIEPTNVCNLSCTFCPQSNPAHPAGRRKGYLEVEDFRLFLGRIKEAGSSNKNINLTLDGEPFCNRNFLRLIELAVERGFFPVFATNATLLDREKTDRLTAIGPFRATIDFASDREIFETVRGQRGHFDVVRANLTYLMEKSRTNPGVHLDIFDITSFSGANPQQSLARMRTLFPSSLPRRVKFASRQFHNFCGHLKMGNTSRPYRLCPYPWTQMAVAFNGDCVACCRDTAARSILGNVFDDPVMKIWNNDKYREFRRNLIDNHPDRNAACRNCDLPSSGGQRRWKLSYITRSLLRR